MLLQTLVAIGWTMSSLLMSLANKMAVTASNAPLALAGSQMLVTTLAACATCDFRFGKGSLSWAFTVPPLFVFMLCASLLSMEFVSLGAWVVIRNLGPMVTLLVESTCLHQTDVRMTYQTVSSTIMVAIGAWIYEAYDIQFSPIGVALVMLNLIAAVSERIAQRHLLAVEKVDISKPSLMILNNMIGMCLVLIVMAAFAREDVCRLLHAMNQSASTTMWVFLSCVIGVSLSYFGIWLQGLISATSFMILGGISKVLLVISGMIFLAETSAWTSWLGVALSVLGGLLYSVKELPVGVQAPKRTKAFALV